MAEGKRNTKDEFGASKDSQYRRVLESRIEQSRQSRARISFELLFAASR